MDANLPVVLYAVTEKLAENETVQRTVVDWLLLFSGIVTAITVIGGAFIWLVWPRVRERLVKELVTPIQETHKSLTVNGGRNSPPTVLDKIHKMSLDIEALGRVGSTAATRAADLGDKVDLLTDLVQDTRKDTKDLQRTLADHEDRGANYLGQVEVVLKQQGIELPPNPKGDVE